MVCVELAKKFNLQDLPKKVEFLTAWVRRLFLSPFYILLFSFVFFANFIYLFSQVLEIPKEKGSVWCGLEHYIGISLLVFFIVGKEGKGRVKRRVKG